LMITANDSKAMTAQQREEVFKEIVDKKFAGRIAWAIAEASVSEIDKQNILKAALLAMSRAVQKLEPRPDYVLVDGCNRPPELLKSGEVWTRGTGSSAETRVPARPVQPEWLPSGGVEAVIEGDGRISSIGAASILAKVHRDEIMMDLDKKFPQYGFGSHKGYGTKAHRDALKEHGACAAHRKSFGPVAETLSKGSLFRAFAKAKVRTSEEDTALEPDSRTPEKAGGNAELQAAPAAAAEAATERAAAEVDTPEKLSGGSATCKVQEEQASTKLGEQSIPQAEGTPAEPPTAAAVC